MAYVNGMGASPNSVSSKHNRTGYMNKNAKLTSKITGNDPDVGVFNEQFSATGFRKKTSGRFTNNDGSSDLIMNSRVSSRERGNTKVNI